MIFAYLFHVRNSFFLFFITQDRLVEILWLPSIVGQKISVYFRYQFRFIDLIKIEFLRSPKVRSRTNRWVWWWDSKEGERGDWSIDDNHDQTGVKAIFQLSKRGKSFFMGGLRCLDGERGERARQVTPIPR